MRSLVSVQSKHVDRSPIATENSADSLEFLESNLRVECSLNGTLGNSGGGLNLEVSSIIFFELCPKILGIGRLDNVDARELFDSMDEATNGVGARVVTKVS